MDAYIVYCKINGDRITVGGAVSLELAHKLAERGAKRAGYRLSPREQWQHYERRKDFDEAEYWGDMTWDGRSGFWIERITLHSEPDTEA